MTVQNLPAVRTRTALAVHQPAPSTPTAQAKPVHTLPLPTALFISSGAFAVLAVVSLLVGRIGQALLLGGATAWLLLAAFVERGRERRS